MTNADKIRQMSNEDLAEWILNWHIGGCPDAGKCRAETCYACWLNWLRQEVVDNG